MPSHTTMSIEPRMLSSAAERVRTERVLRRLHSGRDGISTRNFHRDLQLQHRAFIALLGLTALGGVVLLVG